ncbi:error-prone DNA polymerase [Phaeovibrio sulfidiphilus]|uniref:Error-prone DNA polymerase n=1 Tax=Phaeovibrio sulfidiphilus TaxID=1220600 RepID=A0A8J6YZ01_9PROT|nr:error-prone DNA polymerase [Phaeovibrio sulfidiphilus]MBE1237133.1 error-prone DNA polymerase [Phaeovibrio sulfidiphilus]
MSPTVTRLPVRPPDTPPRSASWHTGPDSPQGPRSPGGSGTPPPWVELQVTSHYSFLRGASSCDELFETARRLGMRALAITDRNSLAGVVRAREAARATGVRLIVGARLDLRDGASLLVYPRDKDAYSGLCRLLSLGKARAGKGRCDLGWEDVHTHARGLIAILVSGEPDDALRSALGHTARIFGQDGFVALTPRRRPDDAVRLHRIERLGQEAGVRPVVTGDVLFHSPERRRLQDVLTCIRLKTTIDALGFRRERHADRHLRAPAEMQRLLARHPEALERSRMIADLCRFSLDELVYQYPEERADPSRSPQENLEDLTREGARRRYPDGVPEKVGRTLDHELALIRKLDYAPYFLTVHAIVRFARSRGILCQGRGSAANSAVCYVLGITSVDPASSDLLFERFLSEERAEPPDIDVDFEHDRREIVLQWIFETYGRNHAALCATVIRYRTRGALRDVGRALGLDSDTLNRLLELTSRWSDTGLRPEDLEGCTLNLQDWRIRLALELSEQLAGAPRHLSQHPGGFVLTREPLDSLVPVEPAAMEGRQVIEWDKDDIDALKFMKVDCLALGMLSCLRRAFDLLARHKGIPLDLARIPPEDPATYTMISRADTLGVFQIESRAQMSMLPRLKPRTFYDLVIQVAIVRPGPIQGDMVHPYLRRRNGLESVSYPSEDLRTVLDKTLGVPLFQEQAMRVAIVAGGFTPGEADQLRKSMATFRNRGGVDTFETRLVEGMVANGYERGFAEATFRQIQGFGSYGFPESHAASFALIAYASSYLKCHHPEVFCTALLNAQPMGFYAPAQIVRDARAHGVEIRPVCVNASRWDCTLEPSGAGKTRRLAVRLGFRMIRGLSNTDMAALILARTERPFDSLDDLRTRCTARASTLERLADADAFRPAFGLPRREALWAVRALKNAPLDLFRAASAREKTGIAEVREPEMDLVPMPAASEVLHDYGTVGLSLRAHPVSFLRGSLSERRIVTCEEATSANDGRWLEIAGLVLVRQRPGTARGVLFVTLEDETGITNVVVWKNVYEEFRRTLLTAPLIGVRGSIQREGEVVHLVARRITDLSALLGQLGGPAEPTPTEATGFRVPTRDFR